MALTKLAGGTVYDPANGVDGQVRDLWVQAGKVVPPPASDVPADRVFDLTGLVVMPGGVDMHAHIAGPKVNAARKLRPEDRRGHPFARTDLLRSGTGGSTPTSFVTGYLYAGLGYTTVFDAAVTPLGARLVHDEFHDTPVIDKGFFAVVGNNQFVLERVAAGDQAAVTAFCGWLLNSTRGYALKVVNPGGVETWKAGKNALLGLDDEVPGYGISGRQIAVAVAAAADELKLPHPMHLHCNRLGVPGNWQTTLDTMRAVGGRRAHFTHIQFHSYGGGPDDQGTFCSKVPQLADYVNAHPDLHVDVGQVVFGETTSMTGDGALGHYLHKVTGRKWYNADTECEGGCGVVPITYKDKSLVNALQWAIGLEWYLLVTDPWRVGMSTDHPNGGAFVAYPEIIALLMSRDYRREALKRLPEKVKERCTLPDLQREYTLNEIAVITRAGPARMLGLSHKGHLGPGADADVTVYTPGADIKAMFELPRYVFKAGELIVEHGEIRRVPFGPTLCVEPGYDAGQVPRIRDWFERSYSLRFANYPVGDEHLARGRVVVREGGGGRRPPPPRHRAHPPAYAGRSLVRAMKLILAIIPPSKLEAVKEALNKVEVFRLTVVDVQGFGRQKGQTEVYRGHELTINMLRKVQLQIAVNEDFVEPTVNAVIAAARTGPEGRIGDGKIFILPLEDCIRIRTGERGPEAI